MGINKKEQGQNNTNQPNLNISNMRILYGIIILVSLAANAYFGWQFVNKETIDNFNPVGRNLSATKIKNKQQMNLKESGSNLELLDSIKDMIQEENKKTIDQINDQINLFKRQILDQISKVIPGKTQEKASKTQTKEPNSNLIPDIDKKVLPKLKGLQQSNKKITTDLSSIFTTIQQLSTLSNQTNNKLSILPNIHKNLTSLSLKQSKILKIVQNLSEHFGNNTNIDNGDLIDYMEEMSIQIKNLEFLIDQINDSNNAQDQEQEDSQQQNSQQQNIWKVNTNKNIIPRGVQQESRSKMTFKKNQKFEKTQIIVNLESYLSPIEKSKTKTNLDLSCLFESQFKACEHIPIDAFLQSLKNSKENKLSIAKQLKKNNAQIVKLDLKMNSLDSQTFSRIINSLQKHQNLNFSDIHILDLSHNNFHTLSSKSLQNKSNFITEMLPNLQELNLKQNLQINFSQILKFSQHKMNSLQRLAVSIESIFVIFGLKKTKDDKLYEKLVQNIRQNWLSFNTLEINGKSGKLNEEIRQRLQKVVKRKQQKQKQSIFLKWTK